MSVAQDQLTALVEIGVSTVTGILVHDLEVRNCYLTGVKPRTNHPGVAGPAATLRFVPVRNDLFEDQYGDLPSSPHRSALEEIRPGEILVAATGGELRTGIAGDMFTRRLKARGALAFITDGCLRDASQLEEIDLPLFSAGLHGAGIPAELVSAGRQETIGVAGVSVVPGDIIVADSEGCAVVPLRYLNQVLELGSKKAEEEEFQRHLIGSGASLHTTYPMDDETRRRYDEWDAAGRPAL